jgi:hypothetical protein
MRALKQSTAVNASVFMTSSADHISGATGLTLTILSSQNGGAFASITPTVTEIGNGWYVLALTTTHTNTLGDLVFHITGGAGADPTDLLTQVFVDLPGGSVSSVTGAVGSVTGLNPALLDVAVSTRLSGSAYTAPDNTTIGTINGKIGTPATTVSGDIVVVNDNVLQGIVDTLAVKAKTDNLPSDPASNTNVEAVASDVWDVTLASHEEAGSTGLALSGAGSGGGSTPCGAVIGFVSNPQNIAGFVNCDIE